MYAFLSIINIFTKKGNHRFITRCGFFDFLIVTMATNCWILPTAVKWGCYCSQCLWLILFWLLVKFIYCIQWFVGLLLFAFNAVLCTRETIFICPVYGLLGRSYVCTLDSFYHYSPSCTLKHWNIVYISCRTYLCMSEANYAHEL